MSVTNSRQLPSSPAAFPVTGPSAAPNAIYFDATVRSIEQFVEQDVDMEGPASQPEMFLVLDTNVLLHNFDVIRQFTADIEKIDAPLLIIIPSAVLSELDAQKNSQKLAWFARRASTWILERLKERKCVKGQTRDEQYDPARPNNDPKRRNDFSILDCCLYFRIRRGIPGYLASGDKNLCSEALIQDIPIVQPSNDWCSRDMATQMFPLYPNLSHFSGYRAPYRPDSELKRTKGRVDEDGMAMDVDDINNYLPPSHALDSLHFQVIEHFGTLLRQLVRRVGDPNDLLGPVGSTSRSRYAPAWSQEHFLNWSASTCLEYLLSKKPLRGPTSNPQVQIFFMPPYSGRGSRRGQDWSRRDWEVALTDLGKIAALWTDGALVESLAVLQPHIEYIFSMPMKPTGS